MNCLKYMHLMVTDLGQQMAPVDPNFQNPHPDIQYFLIHPLMQGKFAAQNIINIVQNEVNLRCFCHFNLLKVTGSQ